MLPIAKKFWPSLSVNSKKKKIVLYCHHDYRLDYERYFLGGKTQNYFVISTILNFI
jgi:hypothetical protein